MTVSLERSGSRRFSSSPENPCHEPWIPSTIVEVYDCSITGRAILSRFIAPSFTDLIVARDASQREISGIIRYPSRIVSRMETFPWERAVYTSLVISSFTGQRNLIGKHAWCICFPITGMLLSRGCFPRFSLSLLRAIVVVKIEPLQV